MSHITSQHRRIARDALDAILAYIDAEVMGDFRDYASHADIENIKNIILNSVARGGQP